MNTLEIILIISATLTGLMAGLFYAWSCSVMPGFARLNDKEFVSAMKQTNRAIQNPIFFAAFFGAPIFLIISTILNYGESRFVFLFSATMFYLIGTFGVTVFGNIPLNNSLDRFNLESISEKEINEQRANFEGRWTRLNHLRAVTSTIALVLNVYACFV